MFRRKIIKEFEAWKNSGGKKKALVVKGMRQIGKTSSVLEFARQNYEHLVYVNFKEQERGSAARILQGDLGLYKGAIFENIVADCFSKQGRPLFYFHKDSGLEIDFVTMVEGQLALVEVKATSGNTKSARTVLENPHYEAQVCYKLSGNNLGVSGKKITIPYYMAMFLD